MSDFGINGIPNYGFAGGSAGLFGGNAGTGTPAMSSAQIMASLYGNYSPGMAQNTLASIYGGGGFGAQPAYYAALGAAYGRQVPASSPAAVAAAFPQYNAPMQYGWMHNEGAPAPATPQVYNRGEFNPQTYGWEHNEGAFNPFADNAARGQSYSGGGIGSDMLYGGQNGPANPYLQMFRMPQANPSYFNPATYSGAGGNYGIPYNGQPMGGDIGFSRQPSYPNIGYNPGMQNFFANPSMQQAVPQAGSGAGIFSNSPFGTGY